VANNKQVTQQMWESNEALKRLARLTGTWRTEISLKTDPPIEVRGETEISWLPHGPFLMMSGSVDHPDFPNGMMIVGADDSSGRYTMLYFDSRGVARIYEMSLSDEVWQLTRDAPDFPQRYTGRFSDGGDTITGCWEKSSDGSTWETDFDVTYRRVTHGR
jgi:hypothetical protein